MEVKEVQKNLMQRGHASSRLDLALTEVDSNILERRKDMKLKNAVLKTRGAWVEKIKMECMLLMHQHQLDVYNNTTNCVSEDLKFGITVLT